MDNHLLLYEQHVPTPKKYKPNPIKYDGVYLRYANPIEFTESVTIQSQGEKEIKIPLRELEFDCNIITQHYASAVGYPKQLKSRNRQKYDERNVPGDAILGYNDLDNNANSQLHILECTTKTKYTYTNDWQS